VEALGAQTVKFTLEHPSMTLLPTMAANGAGCFQMSPSFQRWGNEEVRLHPAETGPFKLACWDQNQIIVLEENPRYSLPFLQAAPTWVRG
jgi:ABC-type transport system substrate-binding protein